jgi:hypothetical protein
MALQDAAISKEGAQRVQKELFSAQSEASALRSDLLDLQAALRYVLNPLLIYHNVYWTPSFYTIMCIKPTLSTMCIKRRRGEDRAASLSTLLTEAQGGLTTKATELTRVVAGIYVLCVMYDAFSIKYDVWCITY